MKKIFSYTMISLFYVAVVFLGFICAQYRTQIKCFFFSPKVSIIMSTYNRENELPTVIESVLNQTYTDFEFIIVNDGSTDETDRIIRFYAKKDGRIVYLKNDKNKGTIYSLNRGIYKARGKYIVRMDDDGRSALFRIERQVLAMDTYPDITLLGSDLIYESTLLQRQVDRPVIEDPNRVEIKTYFGATLAHPTIIVRRDFLEKNHIWYNPEYLYAEDYDLYRNILEKGGRISILHEPLVFVNENISKQGKHNLTREDTFKKIQKERLRNFFDAPDEMLGSRKSHQNQCEILKKMVSANETKKILNQETLKNIQLQMCYEAREDILLPHVIEVKHPQWKDRVLLQNDGKFFLIGRPSERGVFQQDDDQTITLYWEEWPAEIFQLQDDQHYVYLKKK